MFFCDQGMQYSYLALQNEKLRSQVACLRASITSYQERNQTASEQLEQCLLELQAIQTDKESIEQRNEELSQELQSLQNAFGNLNKEYHFKAESIMSLEVELSSTRTSQKEICKESRNIVENVKTWLREQKKINDHLNNKMKEKNDMIKRLKTQRE